uniref:AlNc14C226G9222 protein n=1 Tax=Albugo laibachii Nc14 TaxID=890382 RepID=F0WS84_9STRA|nr:AlNc14C226G9222 [Albugo laibachii Nc14]|eukprot:CCA24202.1 AlNc14C226G9222 [Albugo laibachii Nc14]
MAMQLSHNKIQAPFSLVTSKFWSKKYLFRQEMQTHRFSSRFWPMLLLYFLDPPNRENHALQLRVGYVAALHTRVLRIFSAFARIVSHVTSGICSSSQGPIQNTRARSRKEQHTY